LLAGVSQVHWLQFSVIGECYTLTSSFCKTSNCIMSLYPFQNDQKNHYLRLFVAYIQNDFHSSLAHICSG